MTANDLEHALGVRYAPPAWALFWEVPNATGNYVQRRCDALAMGLWLSDPQSWGRDVRARLQRLLDEVGQFEALLTPPSKTTDGVHCVVDPSEGG